ncbi:hypothetical protein I302_106590 [Kwoniella bestiolae CBS 10118]|uniref:Protein CPL1-like domain-containing protein n=1 Tax=Kwoniella bestiolae CBS 10118 TaxID=1296100 RepID=A0A1B9G0Y7_9TREE|nr:hypothetical protein I302_06148 [Kwoniella bestiolae CBS 10118]OCF24687.1 hypothetical protein I302_06148 [Kwoniella bestiolae CBS 10118]
MFAPYLAPIGVFTFLTLSQKVLADNLFVGCYKNDGSTFTIQQADDPDTSVECSTYCGYDGYAYSAFQQNTLQCYCSNDYPRQYYMGSGTDTACDDTSALNVRVTQTSFQSLGCKDTVVYDPDGFQDFLVLNPKDCFRNCNGAYQATYVGNPQNGYYTCHCQSNELEMIGNDVTCSGTSYFVFFHSRDAQASGLTRRRARDMRELQARRRRQEVEYCPHGLTACNVAHSGSYECLDTDTELESCGGCLFGQYGNATSVIGQDCTTMGAALGASTCLDGQCVASACKKGLKLVDGRCQE